MLVKVSHKPALFSPPANFPLLHLPKEVNKEALFAGCTFTFTFFDKLREPSPFRFPDRSSWECILGKLHLYHRRKNQQLFLHFILAFYFYLIHSHLPMIALMFNNHLYMHWESWIMIMTRGAEILSDDPKMWLNKCDWRELPKDLL